MVPFLVERRGQRGRGELSAAGSPERRAAVLVLSCFRRKTMGVFFLFSLGLTVELG
jgi:hypothetical protein